MGRDGRKHSQASQGKWELWIDGTQGAEKSRHLDLSQPLIMDWGRPGERAR